jgi:hypothetical protein
LLLTPTVMTPIVDQFFDVGIVAIVSWLITCRLMTFCTSTTGDAALTTTVSSIVPTFRSGLTVAVNCAGSSMPSRFTDEKPGSVNVTVYTPGRKSVILYWPWASVVAVRTRSISAGLAASTVTPGSTAPLVSRTTPAMPVVCANARCVEITYATAAMQDRRTYLRIATS